MNLFRRRRNPAESAANSFELASAAQKQKEPVRSPEISLSAEQQSILEKPIDPRVDRILQGIYKDKAAAERALNARHIIDFPHGDTGERHVIQDEHGFWRIVPGPVPSKLNELYDAL